MDNQLVCLFIPSAILEGA